MGLTTLANRALAIKLLAALTTYGFTILLARLMAPQDFGKIAIFLNLSLLLSVLGARGGQLAALRYIPPMMDQSDSTGLSTFKKWAAGHATLATLAIYLIALGVAFTSLRAGMLPNYTLAQLGLGLTLIPLAAWIDLQSHYARGYHYFALSMVPKEILWRASAGAVAFFTYLYQSDTTISTGAVLTIMAGALFVIACGQALVLRRKAAAQCSGPVHNSPDRDEWKTSGGSFWITSVSNIFLANADVIFVGLFIGSRAAGVYFAGNRLAMLLAFFLNSTNLVLAPLLAGANRTGAHPAVAKLVQQATVKNTIPTAVFGATMAVFAPLILSLFGDDFILAAGPLRILILAAIISAAIGPAEIALNMCGFHRISMSASAASLLVSFLALTISAVSGSAVAVATAVLFATTFRKSMFWILTRKHLFIRTDILAALTNSPLQLARAHP